MTRTRKSIILTSISGLFLIFFLIIRNTSPASADMAPPNPPVGSDLFPGIGTTNVRILSENVLIDIAGTSPYPSGHAIVTAQFILRNLGDSTEQMRARFPMNHAYYDFNFEVENQVDFCDYSPMPSLDNLRVWVDAEEVNVNISYQRMVDHAGSPDENGETVYITVPCWAYFDLSFPPATDVQVKVSYTVPGYNFQGGGNRGYGGGGLEFAYVLGTGAGWKDTIGKADIVARLPYEVQDLNFIGCSPDDCTRSGMEITWHFEDFEPEGNLSLRIIRPSIWLRILEETAYLQSNPNDGEAWGRLAKAYKEANTGNKGMLGPVDDALYNLSQEAYQKAVDLLPDDADWHYGYAHLLCNPLIWYSDSSYEAWQACLLELKAALDLEPGHESANELLRMIDSDQGSPWIDMALVDLNGDQPVFLLLSQTPTPSQTPTQPPSITPTQTKLVHTGTPTSENSLTPSKTASSTPEPKPTRTKAHAARQTATAAAAVPKPAEVKSNAYIYFGVFLILFLGALVAARWRKF